MLGQGRRVKNEKSVRMGTSRWRDHPPLRLSSSMNLKIEFERKGEGDFQVDMNRQARQRHPRNCGEDDRGERSCQISVEE